MPGAVTVGGLVINLSANTDQLKTDLADVSASVKTTSQAMTNAWAGVAAESDNATAAGARLVKQLQDEIATFGMSSQELMQHKANLNGVGDEVAALIGRLNNLKDASAGLSAETAQLAIAEANTTARIRDMVAASLAEVAAMDEATAATQGLTAAQTQAAGVTRSWADAQKAYAQNMAGVAASMKLAQTGTAALSTETQKILAQYDPLGTKMRSLQANLATLRKEMGDSVDPAAIKAFQGLEDEIEKTSKLMQQAGADGFGAAENSANKSALATAGATRELMVLGDEVLSGNFSRIPGSMLVLTNRAGGLGAMIEAVTGTFGMMALGAAAVVAPIGLAFAAAYQGKQDFDAMNSAIGMTSNYAGQTVDSISELAARIGAAGQMTTGTAKQMVTSFVASGQIGGQALEQIARLAGNYAQETGASVEDVTPKLIQLFSDPKQGAEDLNKSMHFLTQANIDYIGELDSTGQHQQAQLVLAQALGGQLALQAKDVSGLTSVWHEFANALSGVWDLMKQHASGSLTPLQAAQAQLDQLQSTPNLGGDPEIDKQIAQQKQLIASLIAGQQQQKAAATAASQAADVQNAITNELNQGQQHQIDLLKQKRMLLDSAGDSNAVDQRRLELDNQIETIERAMGAEARQMIQQQLTDGEQYNLLVQTGQASALQNQLKMGLLTQEQFDTESTQNKLQANAYQQNFELQMANVTGLTPLEKQAHLDKLNYLQEEARQIKANGDAAVAYDNQQVMKGYMDALSKSGQDELSSLDQQIAKEREHGLEIGKTKEQVDALRASQQQQLAVALQGQVDATETMLSNLDPGDKALDNARAIYTAWLAQTKAQIAEISTLAQVRSDNSDADAGAKAAADLDKYLDPTKAQNFGNALKGSLGAAAKAMVDLTGAMAQYGQQQDKNEKARGEAALAYMTNQKTEKEYLADLDALNQKSTEQQLNSYGNMASAASGFFKQNSTGYKALQAVSEAYHAAELVLELKTMATQLLSTSTVTAAKTAAAAEENAATASTVGTTLAAESAKSSAYGVSALAASLAAPFPANLVAYATVAAMLAAIGVAVSGGGGSSPSVSEQRQTAQGTGTVLGDDSAKSDSVSKAIELTSSNSSTQINYLANLLTTLQTIQSDINSFASELVRSTDVSNPNINLNTNNGLASTIGTAGLTLGGAALGTSLGMGAYMSTGASIGGVPGLIAGAVVGALASKIPAIGNLMTSIFGGKQTLDDSGVTMDSASLGSILANGAKASTYADITTSGGWFSSDSHDTKETALDASADQQFTTILASLSDSVKQASSLLGVTGDDFTNKLDSFVVDIGKVSLKGLSGDDIEKQLEAVFSKVGDQMAQAAIPDLQQFQQVGEGYLDTLVRVASDYTKVDASLQSIGKTFGSVGVDSIAARESLISLMGGIDDFQSKTSDYAQNFLTKAQQLAPVQAYVTQQLDTMNLGWVQTRDQFASVIQGLDLTTTAGQQTYASLMNLESAFAAVTPALVDTTKSAQDIVDERTDLQNQLDNLTMTQAQLNEKARDAIDDSNKALYDQVQAAQAAKDAIDTHNSLLDLESQIYALTGDKASAAAVLTEQHAIALAALDPALQAATEQLWGLQAAAQATEDMKTAASSLLGDVDTSLTTLQNVTKTTTDAISARITAEQALSDAINSTLKSMEPQTASLTDRAAAEAQIKAAVASVQAGGALPTADSLQDAFSVVSQDASAQFATYADYLKDKYSTESDLSQLGSLTDNAVSVDQQQLDTLNNMLTAAQQQVDLLKGVATTGLTIAQALAGLQTAIASAQANPYAGSASVINSAYQSALGRTPDAAGLAFWQGQAANGVSYSDITSAIDTSPEAQIQKLYQQLLGRPADAAGLSFWLNSGASMSDIETAIEGSSEYAAHEKQLGIPGFATGGDFAGGWRIVGENGPELEATGPSRIFNASQTSDLFSRLTNPSSNNDALLAEMKAMRQELAALRVANSAENLAIAKSSAKSADALDGAVNGVRPLTTAATASK